MAAPKTVAACETPEPDSVWSRHISRRQPCLLASLPSDISSLAQIVSPDNLSDKAGDDIVNVEVRAKTGRAFGNGKKQPLSCTDFLHKVSSGDTSVYLTTQSAEIDADGFPALLTSPLKRLVDSGLPLKPALTGNLLPQAINLWMGASKEGSSSGLHHDFHDNLYVLIRGRKRFRLYPPSAVDCMYAHGKLATVHPNGRIVYKSQGDIQADGSSAADVRRWRLKRRIDAAACQPPSAPPAATSTRHPNKAARKAWPEGVGRGVLALSGLAATPSGEPEQGPSLRDNDNEEADEAGGGDRDDADVETALEEALLAAAEDAIGFSRDEEWQRSGRAVTVTSGAGARMT